MILLTTGWSLIPAYTMKNTTFDYWKISNIRIHSEKCSFSHSIFSKTLILWESRQIRIDRRGRWGTLKLPLDERSLDLCICGWGVRAGTYYWWDVSDWLIGKPNSSKLIGIINSTTGQQRGRRGRCLMRVASRHQAAEEKSERSRSRLSRSQTVERNI